MAIEFHDPVTWLNANPFFSRDRKKDTQISYFNDAVALYQYIHGPYSGRSLTVDQGHTLQDQALERPLTSNPVRRRNGGSLGDERHQQREEC